MCKTEFIPPVGLCSPSKALGLGFCRPWQREVNRGALAESAFRPSSSAVAGDNAAHIGQADSGALEFASGMQPLEHSEELAGEAGVEADAIVPHVEDVFRRFGARADLDPRTGAGPR